MTKEIHLDEPLEVEAGARQPYYTRFTLSQRIEHFLLLLSFTTLGITGLVQKYSQGLLAQGILGALGGIQTTRLIHRSAAVVLMAVSIYHLAASLYRVIVLKHSISMLPLVTDFQHLIQDVLYYLGRRERKAYYGRYSYAEKMEYLAVVWGTVVMAITGFMMWNPIATTNLLPGEAVPAAKAAHGGEALLAVLAIIIWHFYHVHIRHFNKSMFTGKMSREEMLEEHPAELAEIEAGRAGQRPPEEYIRRTQRIYIPIAAVIVLAGAYALYRFVTFEETAISTVPPGETAPVFVPITPTPSPTPEPTPTLLPGEAAAALNAWNPGVSDLLSERCGSCHVNENFGELSLGSYESALAGGKSGPAIVPGDPEASVLMQIQLAGGHPGQLAREDLEKLGAWIEAGAPEN